VPRGDADDVSGAPHRAVSVADVLGDGGLLAAARPGFVPRAAQLAMAELAMTAFRHEGVAIIEAGTGTGKTFAYLVPALLSGKRVVISTGTRALQDQIAERDVPALAAGRGSSAAP
jgi:ATP-dependent DNA helicase DinG